MKNTEKKVDPKTETVRYKVLFDHRLSDQKHSKVYKCCRCTNRKARKYRRTGRGHCMGRFRPSWVRLVYFLRKSTEFHVKRTECQRILLLAISKRRPLSYSLHNHSPIAPQLFPDHSRVGLCFRLPSKF